MKEKHKTKDKLFNVIKNILDEDNNKENLNNLRRERQKNIKEFDETLFENLVDKIIIGEIDKYGNINKKIIIISKNIDELLVKKYKSQYKNIEFININPFHDRYIILDRNIVYSSGMSLKDIGKSYSYINMEKEEIFIQELLKRLNDML